MKYTPRPYQQRATGHLIDVPRCALFAGMGMGKSLATLTALDAFYLGGESMPALVLAPLRVARSVWPDEAAKWDHLRSIEVQPVVGSLKAREQALKNTNASVFTINYEQIQWLVEQFDGEPWPFGTVVADESTKLKGFRLRQGTKRAKAIASVAHKHVRRWINLTGTPAPNGLQDLWGQTWFLDAGERLGRTWAGFVQRWFETSYDGYNLAPREYAQEQIEVRLKDICLTLLAEDYFDLDAPIVNNVYVDLPGKARKIYRQMEKEMFAEIAGHGVEAFNAASRTIKCLQIANGAAYVDDAGNWEEIHDAKLQALESVIEEAAGAPVLVAYHFKSDLVRLRSAFPRGRVLDSDPRTLDDWNAGKIPVLFAHPASAGHGLNLQDGGNILAFFGLNWNLEERLQVIERIGPVRQLQAGHSRPVFVHNIIARDTVDDIVLARVESKRDVLDLLLEAMKERKAA